MAREFGRPQRVADFIKREVANLLQFEVRDPRIGMVSITDVEVNRDLSHAKVYVTVLGKDSEEESKESIVALNNAAGFMRTQLAKSNQARTTPRLRFYFDSSVLRGLQLSSLIDQAVEADSRHDENPSTDEEE